MKSSRIIISLIILFACPFLLRAQSTFQGLETNITKKLSAPFTYTRSFAATDTLLYTSYNMYTGGGYQFGDVNVSYSKNTNNIHVIMERLIGSETVNDEYNLVWNDTMGLIFGMNKTYRKDPVVKQDIMLAFADENMSQIMLCQITDHGVSMGAGVPERISYDLDLPTALQYADNEQYFKIHFPPPPVIPNNRAVTAPSSTTTTQKTTNISADNKTNVIDWKVDSLRVILKPVLNSVVSVRYFIRGGVTNFLGSKEGIEAVAIEMAISGGTKSYPGTMYQTALDNLGSTITYNVETDYSVITLECLKENLSDAWKIFCDVLQNPLMTMDAFNKAKDKYLSLADNRENDDEAIMKEMVFDNLFQAKYYDKNPFGSTISLNKLMADDVRQYYASLISKKKGFLVVVGDLKVDDITQLIHSGLRSLPIGGYVPMVYSQTDISNPILMKVMPGSEEINHVIGVLSAPDLSSSDALKMDIAMQLLNSRLQNTSSVTEWTTDADFSMTDMQQNISLLTFSTSSPDKAYQAIIDEIRKAKQNGFTNDELQAVKDNFLLNYYLKNESNSNQSMLLGEAEILSSWKDSENLTGNVNGLTITDINTVMRNYFKAIRVYALGSVDAFNPLVFQQKIEP